MLPVIETISLEQAAENVGSHKKGQVLDGINKLLVICEPGTDIEITLDVPDTNKTTMKFSIEE